MSVAKVIEITSQSDTSFDDAIAKGIKRASDSVDALQSAWVKDMEILVKDGKPATYRVHLKTTFLVKDKV